MAFTFQFRRGTALQWTNANPVLSQGEPGFETNTGKFKIGDGSTNWTGLDYASAEVTLQAIIDAGAVAVPAGASDGDLLGVGPGGTVQAIGAVRFPDPEDLVTPVSVISTYPSGAAWGIPLVPVGSGGGGGSLPTPSHRWNNPPTTGPTSSYWPSTIPSSPAISIAYGATANQTGPVADAFGTGVNGWRFGNDSGWIDLGTLYPFEPDNEDRNVFVTRAREVIIDNVDPGTNAYQWFTTFYGWNGDHTVPIFKTAIVLDRTAGAFRWRIAGEQGTGSWLATAAATQTIRSDGLGIDGPITVALVLQGGTSKLIIEGGGASRQTIPFDATGRTGYDHLEWNGGASGTERGWKTVKMFEHYPNVGSDAEVDAILTAAAA
jgi:hypothetical protein